MTEQVKAPGGAELPSVSPILAMHARYEVAVEEHHRLDVARSALEKSKEDHALCCRYSAAMNKSMAETDALRRAILYQVPETWPEALVLARHIHVAHDMEDAPSEEDKAALQTAIDTLFDFMCCEVDQDHEALGPQFQTSANLVFFARRLRRGVTAD